MTNETQTETVDAGQGAAPLHPPIDVVDQLMDGMVRGGSPNESSDPEQVDPAPQDAPADTVPETEDAAGDEAAQNAGKCSCGDDDCTPPREVREFIESLLNGDDGDAPPLGVLLAAVLGRQRQRLTVGQFPWLLAEFNLDSRSEAMGVRIQSGAGLDDEDASMRRLALVAAIRAIDLDTLAGDDARVKGPSDADEAPTPLYVHRLVDAIRSGQPVDLAGVGHVPVDVQVRLSNGDCGLADDEDQAAPADQLADDVLAEDNVSADAPLATASSTPAVNLADADDGRMDR